MGRSFDHTLKDCKSHGITISDLQKLYQSLQFIPVFTAHPTEAMRRSKMEATRRIFATILELICIEDSQYEKKK